MPIRSNSLSRKPRAEKLQHVLERFWFLTEVIGFSLTVVKMKPSSAFGVSCADTLKLNKPKVAISIDFFIIIKLILNDCYWHKDREISETKAIFGAFYQIIMEKKIHIKPQTGLVLEGGGMRGVFTCGVLDYFMDKKIRFPYTIGVSAGACNGLSYMSGQRGRAKFSNIDLLEQYDYIGVKYLFKKRNIMDFDLLFGEFPEHILPYDYDAYFSSPGRYVMVTTNCRTGRANYLEEKKDKKRIIDIVRASSSLPYVCPITYVDDVPMLDGGIVDSIPLLRSMEDGNEKNVVVLTRNRGYRKTSKDMKIPHFIYKKYPRLRVALSNRCKVYNQQLEMVERLEDEGRIHVIRPEKPVVVDRIEKDVNKLRDFYQEGYECAKKMF